MERKEWRIIEKGRNYINSTLNAQHSTLPYPSLSVFRMKKPRRGTARLWLLAGLQPLLQFFQAVAADQLILVVHHVPRVIAEDAGGMILLQDDFIILHKDFQRIAQADVHGSAQFDGDDDPPQIIQFANDPC